METARFCEMSANKARQIAVSSPTVKGNSFSRFKNSSAVNISV